MSAKDGGYDNVVSNPLLHDIVKTFLVRDAKNILSFCSTLPGIKKSRIFRPESPHIFDNAREEWFTDGLNSNVKHYPADAVWKFRRDNIYPSYYIIHEVKTGNYDLETEMAKHYIHHNHVQLYIWSYKKYHDLNTKKPYSYVKLVDINKLRPYITYNLKKLLKVWNGDIE